MKRHCKQPVPIFRESNLCATGNERDLPIVQRWLRRSSSQ